MSADDAAIAAVTSFFDRKRRRSKQPSLARQFLFLLYLVGLFGSFGLYTLTEAMRESRSGSTAEFLTWTRGALTAAALLFVLAVMRFAVWAGPVLVSRPDADWLLPAPLSRAPLLRPRLMTGLALGAVTGGLLGFGVLIVLAPNTETGFGGLLVTSLVSWSLLGVLAAAAGAFVESSRAVARTVMAASLPVVVAAAGLIPAAREHPAFAVWSGPWGWAAAPVLAAAGDPPSGWLAAWALLLLATAVVTYRAITTLDRIHDEELIRRAGAGGGVLASLYLLDLRTVALIRDRGRQDVVGVRTVRLPRPTSPALAIPWRDAVAFARSPSRLGWCTLLVATGAGLAATFPGDGFALSGGVLAGYFGASQLLEPLRIEVEDPYASLLLDRPFTRVALAHTLLPTMVLAVLGAGAFVGWTALGVLPASAQAASFSACALASPLLVLSAAAAAVKGDPPLHLLVYADVGAAMLMAWFLLGPLLALGVPGVIGSVAVAALSNGLSVAGALTLAGFWTSFAVLLGVAVLHDRLRRMAPFQ